MSLRAINQLVIHLQSFRNIQLWYQGLYFISISLYYQNLKSKVYAHPFAHTQNFHPLEQSKQTYDQQIIRTSFIDEPHSKFVSKSFIVKYYEQEIQLNDICHFRIEWDLSQLQNSNLILEAQLYFCDINKRGMFEKLDEKQKQLIYREAKQVKKKKFFLFECLKGVHEYCPILFDENYFSLVSSTIHSILLDYRFRVSKLQLSEFSRLTYNQKMKLIELNKSLDSKKISYYYSILKDLNLPDKPDTLKIIQATLIDEMKKNYETLLHSYTSLFGKVISENERRIFGNRLISPNNLSLFEDQKVMGKRQTLNEEKIFAKYRSRNPQEIIERMLDEVNHISSQLIKLWHCYIDLFKVSPRFSLSCLEFQFIERKRQFWKKLIFINKVKTHDICMSVKDNIDIQKLLINQKIKSKINLQVQEENFVEKRQNLPVFLYNIYETEKSLKVEPNNGESEGIHLIVFVHGFQGNSFDMRVIKNYVSYLYPESMFLCATSNQQLTETDILQMGNRLATEVKTYIIQNFPQNTLGRLSFVGHSLGGIKIRAALPRLLQYRDKFHCLITFSSPHLGYGINTSSVVGAGLWVLKKMKDSECLKQLSMTDNEVLQQTCLFKLSKMQGIEHFKHIFLFSSKQDSYAPFQSARIEISPQFISQKGKQIHCQMVRNILKNVKSGVLRRINVMFKIDQKNLDSLIGRTAHIMFLQNQDLMRALLYTQPQLLA